jgi:hypothetical protein
LVVLEGAQEVMTDEQVQAVIAAILLSGGKNSYAHDLMEYEGGTGYERAILAARRLLVLAEAKTIVPEEHP